MAIQDLTSTFHDLVNEQSKKVSPPKRRKLNRERIHIPGEGTTPFMPAYMKEAYSILNNISTLTRMLANIRRPYLDVHARRPPITRQDSASTSRSKEGDADPTRGLEDMWKDVKYLSNEERDQIDLQVRMILAKCAQKVRDMEELEKRRADLAAKESSPLLRILPSSLSSISSTISTTLTPASTTLLNNAISTHNNGVTLYLTKKLADVSQQQKDMQEERVKRQTERTKTLGGGAGREMALLGAEAAAGTSSAASSMTERGSGGGGPGSWLGGAATSMLASTLGAPNPNARPSYLSSSLPPSETWDLSDDDLSSDADLSELTPSQIQQFESENAQILQQAQSQLAAIQQAESRLLEISALQLQLVEQLGRQTEVAERIWEDAVQTREEVEKGNVQLREARRRMRDGRLGLLVFLIGASLSLLFLHYY